MAADVEEDMDATLARFEAVLREYAPDVLASLQPGLSDSEIREIESQYRLRLTDELRTLYRWRNRSSADVRAEFIPGHWFVPLDHAGKQRGEMSGASAENLLQRIVYAIVAGHRTKWLTVLDDQCGDGYFYDPARRRRGGSFFFHFAEDRQYRFFPSLASLLTGAIECFETRIYRAGRRGASGEDHERSFAVWSRYASISGT